MKITKIFAIGAALALMLASCDSYFDVDLEQNIKTDDAYSTVQDVQNGMIGAYYAFGTYRFYGRDVVALGDMASDLAQASPSTGHFYSIYTYTFGDYDGDLEDIWNYGYKTIDRAVRTINGGEKILAKADELKLTEEDVELVMTCMSQCYALRAISTFTLTNIFGLPFKPGTANTQLGAVLLVDKPLEPFEQTHRSTVAECYAQILRDIELAKEYLVDEYYLPGEPAFFFNEAAIFALEARVKLYMGNYVGAKEAAEQSLDLLKNGTNYDLPSNDIYVSSWSSIAVNDEDIFTISKTDDDNLSANALNTLYGSYRGDVTDALFSLFDDTDIRAKVLDVYAYKYQGTSTAQAVSNIPVFRKSEMYLIIAECEAHLGNIADAQHALFYTAKRNTAITSESELPASVDELLEFIADERARELYLEGHRFFDARRTGMLIDVINGTAPNFDASKFVYPIPSGEINAGFGVVQNEGWEDNLPE